MYILSASTCAKFGVSSWCYYLIIIVILSFSQVTVYYIYIHYNDEWYHKTGSPYSMRRRASEELGKKIKYEEKLLKEAEHQKLILQRQILEEQLDALKRETCWKERYEKIKCTLEKRSKGVKGIHQKRSSFSILIEIGFLQRSDL